MGVPAVDWAARAVPQTSGLHPYVPGKPVEQLLREKGLAHAVKLASNENPFGPSPKAVEAIRRAASGVHRYPDGDARRLKEALAALHGVGPAHILPGNGSNEVLELVIRTFAGPGDEVVYSRRGFIVYALATQAAGATGVAVPEADGLAHDLAAMAGAVTPRTKIVCIANPNNPTGTWIDGATLQAYLDRLPRELVVILDEAYYEYVMVEQGEHAAVHHPGLVLCRTFSKAYGLAGCRIGYAVADPDIVALVNRFREPFNLSLLAQEAALAALCDRDWVLEKVALCNVERMRLEAVLAELGVLAAPCRGNFVLLRHPGAGSILQRLEDQGIIPRPLGPYGMPDCLRVTVGTSDENEAMLAALRPILDSLD
jgi:histidinol-phosphate aminotransferase